MYKESARRRNGRSQNALALPKPRQRRSVSARALRSDTRERILEAAIRMFGAYGFESTTMRDLADAVGIKAPGIYSHFSSKEAILNAAVEWAMHSFSSQVIGPDDPLDLPAHRLKGIVMRHVSNEINDPQATKAFSMFIFGPARERYVSKQAVAQVRSLSKQYIDTVTDILQQIDRNLKPREARMRALIITDMCDSVTRWYRADGPYSPEKIGNFYWLLVSKIVGLK
ncbi:MULTISPECIES: TetR/AcrR family transcriptional regulator [unclassified Bradyrhizobium]|uniref:TetR/AcrR family transcriptional regulator n=1 Tax=unclassified Bradyrhizobium TaxID=2631580 RepID=UPI00247A4C7D|nr:MULTISPECIES: TetR/AcrR family transcriptional regulator [unclassified Bradyrhizobium]WGS19211.1 TetR/AcrR family transcriptional regulator [Bradyrhizobium sp. ISRA463]WGS26048.1 TetR/AcrR family transcriptional regulator [Bradyrhizobium sp. ISRA464]